MKPLYSQYTDMRPRRRTRWSSGDWACFFFAVIVVMGVTGYGVHQWGMG